MKNLVASIQDRLKNFSRKEGIVLNLVLESGNHHRRETARCGGVGNCQQPDEGFL